MNVKGSSLIFFSILLTSHLCLGQLNSEFTSDKTTGCGTLSVNFVDQSTGSPTSWLWNFGDGTPTSAQKNPGHFYNTPGTYTVTLTVTNTGGNNTETKTAFIKVFPFPVADFSQDDTTGCIPFSVNFSDNSTSSSSAIVSWLWNFGDGNNSTLKNPQHTYTVPGTYSVSLFATDQNCTGTKIKSALVKVLDSLSANFTLNSNSSCVAPFDAVFTNTSSPGAGISYLWDFGDGSPTSALQNPPSHTYASFGNYTITLIIKNSAACSDTAKKTLSINPYSSDFTATDSSGCVAFQTSFSAVNTSAVSFNWSFQGGSPANSNSPNPTVTFNSAGSFGITLITANALGCSDTTIVNDFITVFPLPAVNFSSTDSFACKAPFIVDFTGIAPTAVSWSWSFSNGSPASSTSQNPTITYSGEGNNNASLTVQDANGCSNTSQKNSFINVVFPDADFIASPIRGCIPLTTFFVDLSTANPSINQWQWDFGDPASGGANTSSLQSPSHIYNDTGIFDVKLIISNIEGCSDTLLLADYVKAGMVPTSDFFPKDSSGCHPFNLTFTSNSSPYVDDWFWFLGDGGTGSGPSHNHTYTDTGFFDVTLIALHHGCPDTLIVNNAVYVKPPKPNFTASQYQFCEKDLPYDVTFTDASLGAQGWLWKYGDGTSDNIQAPPPHTYPAPGFYTVWLVTENFSNGCKDSISVQIKISNIDVGFGRDTSAGCQPLPITFSDSSTSNSTIVAYKWMFGDGTNTLPGSGNITGIPNTSGTYSNPKHIYPAAGFFNVTLIVFDQLGCSDTLVKDSLIEVKPLPIADFTSDTTNGCAPLAIVFTDNSLSNSPLQNWFWDFGDTNTDSVKNPADTFFTRGKYSVQLIVKDTFNCIDTVLKNNFINVSFPYPAFSIVNDTICNFTLATFTDSSTGSQLSYLWDFGDGSPTDNSVLPSHTYSVNFDTTQILNVSLTLTDTNGCDSTLVNPILISIPEAGFFAGPQNDDCPPFDASFIDSSSSDIISWQWNFGDGDIITKNSPDTTFHLYKSSGYFDVGVIATNALGCKDTLEIDSFIRVPGPAGTFTFSVDSNRCFTEANFSAITQDVSSISWDFRDGVTGTDSVVSHRYETNGFYNPILILKDSNNCQISIESTDTIFVSTATISNLIIPDTNKSFPENSILFTGSSSSPAPVVSWEWNFGDGDSITTTSSSPQKHRYISTGDYKVVLKITDSDGCTSVFDTLISIIEGVITSNVFTPNGDGINDVFTILRNGKKEHYIVIFNRWGEKIYENTAPEIQWAGKNFSGEAVPNGTYYFVLKSTGENGEVTENHNFITIIR